MVLGFDGLGHLDREFLSSNGLLVFGVEQAQVYSIYYSSTLILPVMGEGRKAVEAVAWC